MDKSKPSTEDTRKVLDELVERAAAAVAEGRAKADKLVSEDGSVDARRRAKSLRISMTLWERRTREMMEYIDAHREDEVSA